MNVKLQEKSGIDFVYDGEARRSEMYRNVARGIYGFEDIPEMLRSRGPDSWRSSVCVSPPKLKGSLDELAIIKEFEFVKTNANAPIKVPIDDPYMVAAMSDNRYYTETLREKYSGDPRKWRYEAKREFNTALAKNVILPQVEAVIARGAKWVQLDIPAATIDVEHIPIMVEGINAVVDGISGIKFSLHICYPRRVSLTDKSGYELLFPHILNLSPSVDHISLEVANGNQYGEDLAPFAQYQDERKFEIGLGVVDITLEQQQKGVMETPEMVRERILKSVDVLRDESLIYVAPDCGLRQLSLDRCINLFDVMAEGRDLAKRG